MKVAYLIIAAILIVSAAIILIRSFVPADIVIDNGASAPIYLSSIEATVLSIELDELEHENCGVLFETSTSCPRDKIIIRIDNFENIDAPGTQLLEIGSEVQVYFKYGARPAKLLKDRKQVCEG